MWGSKPKPTVFVPPPASSSPFFPEVGGARVSYHANASLSVERRTRHTLAGQGMRAVDAALEEAKDSNTSARYELFSQTQPASASVNSSNQYPRSSTTSTTPKSHKKLASSLSSESLRGHASGSSSVVGGGKLHHSSSAAVFSAASVSPSPHVLAPQSPPASNASAKLASRVDRWQSVEDLLAHSQAVIISGGKMVNGAIAGGHATTSPSTTTAAGYDPAVFSTFSAGTGEPSPLRAARTEKRRPAGGVRSTAAAAASVPLSPFATIAAPPLPAPSPSTWGGGTGHATSGLRAGLANERARELMEGVGRTLAALERRETVLAVSPSVLLAAGMNDDSAATTNTTDGDDTTGNSDPTASSTSLHRSLAHLRGSQSSAERLWSQHQRMMVQARSTLPPSLRAHTQARIISAVQGLRPRILLDVLAPQAHVLAVTLAALVAQLRRENRDTSALLGHLAAHQRLVLDTLLEFVSVSCATLEGGAAVEEEGGDGGSGVDQLPPEVLAALDASSIDGALTSSLATLMNAPPPPSSSHPVPSPAAALLNAASPARSPKKRAAREDGVPESRYASPSAAVSGERREFFDDSLDEDDPYTHSFDSSTSGADFDPLAGPLRPADDVEEEEEGDSYASGGSDPRRDLRASSGLPPELLHFGSSHAWSLERWRRNALARRRAEVEHEAAFLRALSLVGELSTLSRRELRHLATENTAATAAATASSSATAPAATGATATAAGGASDSASATSYARVNGRWESDRVAMQSKLDRLKVSLDPTYAARYVRHHHRILEIAEVERAAARASSAQATASAEGETKKKTAAVGGTEDPSSLIDDSSSTDSDASLLAIHLSLLRAGESSHSTNLSGLGSSTTGGREHRLPHNIWLATSTPSNAMLADASDEMRGNTGIERTKNNANNAGDTLRAQRVRALVGVENLLADASDSYAALLDRHRALESRQASLESQQASALRSASDAARVHAEALARAEERVLAETERARRAEEALVVARADLVQRQVRVAKLEADLDALGVAARQAKQAYKQHVLDRVPSVVAITQTDEAVTGLTALGVWDANGTISHPDANGVIGLGEEALLALGGGGGSSGGLTPTHRRTGSNSSNSAKRRNKPTIGPSSRRPPPVGTTGVGAGVGSGATPNSGSGVASSSPRSSTGFTATSAGERPKSSRRTQSLAVTHTSDLNAASFDANRRAATDESDEPTSDELAAPALLSPLLETEER